MTSLMPSMLRSFVEVDGEALVMHAGEKPYVVTPAGQVELANRPLTMDAVKRIVSNLLPRDVAHAFEEFGAVQHEIVSPPEFPDESFTVVASRGNDDMWVEIRRRKVGVEPVPEVPVEPAAQRLAIAATVRRGTEAAKLRRSTKGSPPDVEAEPPMAILSAMAAAPPPLPPLTPIVPPPNPVAVSPPAVVLPMPKGPGRTESAPAGTASSGSVERLLRAAAARGATELYLSSNAQPSVRVDDDVRALEGESSLGAQDLESMLLSAVPDREAERMRRGLVIEWTSDVDGAGRVRGTTFRDQRGLGCVFRMMPAQPMTTEDLGVPREVESLALEAGGLVLVAGPRHSGKRTLIAALVDLMNRQRRDRVITIERDISVVHGAGTSIISQREAADDLENAARAALREDPDVLVIESLRSAALVEIALDAAASGQLIVGGVTARDAVSAVDYVIDWYPVETRRQVQMSLATHLRGVVAQVLLQKIGGGRVPAREILLSSPTLSSLIVEGRTSQFAKAIDARQGMVLLNDALAAHVQSGAVDIREAYEKATDRSGFVARLKRLGIDWAG